MYKRFIAVLAVLVVAAITAVVAYRVGLFGHSVEDVPMFVIKDERHRTQVLAVYPDPALLKKHGVTVEAFEVAYRGFLDEIGTAFASVIAEVLTGESSEGKNGKSADSGRTREDEFQSRFGFSPKAFQEIFDNTWMELWDVHPDGSHTVTKRVRMGDRKNHGSPPSREEPPMDISTPPTTLDEAKRQFTAKTALAWPDDASDVRFDEKRAPLLGDGVFYVTFTLPRDRLAEWLKAPPPWDRRHWSEGPVPPDIGSHCGFGYKEPEGWSTSADGSGEYSGGAPEILAILKSREVWYAARSRGPENSRWYNGDLLILDPRTGTVRYCNWDM